MTQKSRKEIDKTPINVGVKTSPKGTWGGRKRPEKYWEKTLPSGQKLKLTGTGLHKVRFQPVKNPKTRAEINKKYRESKKGIAAQKRAEGKRGVRNKVQRERNARIKARMERLSAARLEQDKAYYEKMGGNEGQGAGANAVTEAKGK